LYKKESFGVIGCSRICLGYERKSSYHSNQSHAYYRYAKDDLKESKREAPGKKDFLRINH
jgi:hypothetical protein